MLQISGRALNLSLSILFAITALLIILRTWEYLRNELRIAPRTRARDKFWIGFSMLLFSVMLTAVILFIAAMISSTIISNRAKIAPIDPALFEAFEFPLLLPTTLMGLGVFIVVYPFGEMLYMGQKTSDGAMEIQKWFENRIVDRFRPPFSYIIAILGFIIIYIGPPTIILLVFKMINAQVLSIVPIASFMVYFSWFMTFPIMYLTYYSTIGS